MLCRDKTICMKYRLPRQTKQSKTTKKLKITHIYENHLKNVGKEDILISFTNTVIEL